MESDPFHKQGLGLCVFIWKINSEAISPVSAIVPQHLPLSPPTLLENKAASLFLEVRFPRISLQPFNPAGHIAQGQVPPSPRANFPHFSNTGLCFWPHQCVPTPGLSMMHHSPQQGTCPHTPQPRDPPPGRPLPSCASPLRGPWHRPTPTRRNKHTQPVKHVNSGKDKVQATPRQGQAQCVFV